MFGLDYSSFGNNVSGSDIRLNWTGANLLPRTNHTWLRKSFFVQQSGYYACDWHHEGDYAGNRGATQNFHFSQYEFGTHPFPCGGDHDTAGASLEGGIRGGTGDAGTAHRHEIAGNGNGSSSIDAICTAGAASPPSRGLLVTKGVWLWSARSCEVVSGTTMRHKHYPDLLGSPSTVIVQDAPLASLNTPASPTFAFGPSPWRSSNPTGSGSGYDTDESTKGIHRFFMAFNAVLSVSDILLEFADESTNSAVTAAGLAAPWYINKNPTLVNVTSGAFGHAPVWANANRPALYTA